MWLCCENQKAPLNHHSLSIPPPEKPPNPLKQELNLKNRIVSGARTSPTSLPKKGGYTFRWSWTSIPRKWLAGRQVRGWTRNLFFRLWGIALRSGDLFPSCPHHSDQGIQHRHPTYSTLLKRHGPQYEPKGELLRQCCGGAFLQNFEDWTGSERYERREEAKEGSLPTLRDFIIQGDFTQY